MVIWIPDYFNLLFEWWSEYQTICSLFPCPVSYRNRASESIEPVWLAIIQILTVITIIILEICQGLLPDFLPERRPCRSEWHTSASSCKPFPTPTYKTELKLEENGMLQHSVGRVHSGAAQIILCSLFFWYQALHAYDLIHFSKHILLGLYYFEIHKLLKIRLLNYSKSFYCFSLK